MAEPDIKLKFDGPGCYVFGLVLIACLCALMIFGTIHVIQGWF